MKTILRLIPAALVAVQVLAASTAFAADTRASGLGVCSVYDVSGALQFEMADCKITSHASDKWTIFSATGFEAEFEGDAMEDATLQQNGENYTRTENESRWCYEADQSAYAICFAPAAAPS